MKVKALPLPRTVYRVARPGLPPKPRKLIVPARPREIDLLDPIAPARDEYGLLMATFEQFPRAVRRYLAIGLKKFGLPLDAPPATRSESGTIPEIVMIGVFEDNGFQFGSQGGKGYFFQNDVLGGRVPGGSVADMLAYTGHETVAVYVDSPYHSAEAPFGGGGAKILEDENLLARVASSGGVDRVVRVNREDEGYPLENDATGQLILQDLDRVMGYR